MPGGKNQSSFSFTSVTKLLPSASMQVMRGAVEHEGPFGGSMPVQLADAAGGEAHVHTGESFGNRQFALCDLAGPAAFLHALVREREWVFESLHATSVGDRGTVRIGIGRVDRGIGGTGVTGTAIIFLLIRSLFLRCQLFPGKYPCRCECCRAHAQEAPSRQCFLFCLVAHFDHLYDLKWTLLTDLGIKYCAEM